VRRQAKSKTAAILATVPGCGAYGSLALASRIDPIERFPRPGSLPNYWGLTPRCRNSGEATDRLGSITKQGSAMARFILGQLVLHVLRHDPWMKAWYGRIKRRRGSKIARVAVMRRLADTMERMVKHNAPYVIGGPPQQKRGASVAQNGDSGCRATDAESDFRRHNKVSKRPKKTASSGDSRQRPDAPLTRLFLVGLLPSRARLRFARQKHYRTQGTMGNPRRTDTGKRVVAARLHRPFFLGKKMPSWT
jgi:hypothetical protein